MAADGDVWAAVEEQRWLQVAFIIETRVTGDLLSCEAPEERVTAARTAK